MDYITLKEAAARVGYRSTSTLKAAAKAGALKTEQPAPNLYLTKMKWVDEWLAKPKKNPKRKGAERGKPRPSRKKPENPS